MTVYQGNFSVAHHTIAIVQSKFNDMITGKLLEGVLDGLQRHGMGREQNIDIALVPGAFEIPIMVQALLSKNKYDAIISLGALIRGDTPHFDFIASAVSKQLMQLSVDFHTPVIFGVLTTDTTEQAIARAGGKQGNKGFESAMVALEMINCLQYVNEQ